MLGETIQPVLLAGGQGSRLWPLCSPTLPKPLLCVNGQTSLLQQTAERLEGAAPWVITQAQWAEAMLAHLPECTLIAEPASCNTAAAVATAALFAEPEQILCIMPADHVVEDVPALQAAIEKAAALADAHTIVTLGITPTHPETSYGYIQSGALLGAGYAVERFHEKPDAKTAESYLLQGNCYWNSGIFIARAEALLAAFEAHDPALLALCEVALVGAQMEETMLHLSDAYIQAENISFDVAIMEKYAHSAMVPVQCGWSDVGTWPSLLTHLDARAEPWEHRPWGRYRRLLAGNGWLLKEVEIAPHSRMSLQRHTHRSEHWQVLSGAAQVICGAFDKPLHAGESFFVPMGEWHRLGNPHDAPCHIVELQAGATLCEHDIERKEDDYARA